MNHSLYPHGSSLPLGEGGERGLIKVCGMRNSDNIRAVELMDIDWMGFIFWPGSSRYVAERPSYLPEKTKRVGVFVNADIPFILRHVNEYDLDFIQLHGSESIDSIRELRNRLSETKRSVGIIKAFSIESGSDLSRCAPYEPLVDYFLFDTKCDTVGGSGRQFNWNILQAYTGSVPFLLSGGIGPDSIPLLRCFSHPRCIGIDLNSRFELAPALKDISRLRSFLSQLNAPSPHPDGLHF